MSEGASPGGEPVAGSREQLCLITGASGFIGGRLAERLAADGQPVRCLVRASSDTSRLAGLGVQLVVGDLTEPRSLADAAAGCDSVLHCAALVSDWATRREIVQTNVTGTRSLLEASAAASVRRFVHFSSTDVYSHPGGAAIEESYTATRFGNWYAHSKRLAEEQVRGVGAARGLDAVLLRPATVYGPGSTEAIGEIARAIRAGHMLLIDGGRAIAGLCYVENVIDAALLALHSPAATGRAFNLSDGLPVTWRQLSDDLADGLGCRRARLSVPYRLAGAAGFALEHAYRLARTATGVSTRALLSRQAVQVLGVDQDFSARRARELLGWEPRVDYRAGLQATLEWLRSGYV
ncbi:MAG TPA: NAD-dependent epimerase/dehydratase family protein [Solirubrobacteraceae bacterium]|nr:NAD-dependent epimerase/dehydratase family protein [Solirubrobacteraceae bacterium]